MTLQNRPTSRGRHPVPPYHTPRLRLKPKARPSGHVDGAWWPWSNHLAAELPDLLAVLSVRLGTIGRVVFNVDEWHGAPGQFAVGGSLVRLDGFRDQPPHTLEVVGVNRSNVVLLVVSSNTEADYAHTTMMTAATPNNDTSVAGLLGISEADRVARARSHAGYRRRRGR